MAEGTLIIEHPNRDRPASQATRALVVALLLISTAILTIATVGGWEKIQGAKPVHVAYIVIYLLLAFYIARWRSGLLPVAASFAIILLIFCAISGPQWFARDQPGFEDPLLGASIVGVLTLSSSRCSSCSSPPPPAGSRRGGAWRSSGGRAAGSRTSPSAG